MKQTQQIPTMLPCPACQAVGYIENPVYRGAEQKKKRERAKLLQAEVAHRMDISKSYLSELERGVKAWSERLVLKYNWALREQK